MELPTSAARKFQERSTQLPTTRPTWAEIDLEALAANCASIRARVAGPQLFAVVKADAYGHGLVPVAECLEHSGVDGFCVALAEEGFRLRSAGIQRPVLVLNAAYGQAHKEILEARLTPVIFDASHIEAFAGASGGQPVDVHLKVDTGMSRLGVLPAELPALLSALDRHPQIRVVGVMTHLACADSDPESTLRQLAVFDAAVRCVRAGGHRPRWLHAANSAGALGYPEARHDLIRAGIALFGIEPAPGVGVGLRPVMHVRTEVIALRDVPEGTPVGYNASYHTTRPSRIATVPIGYGDGLLRAASNRAHMLVRGQPCPVVGTISMDLTCLDVTEVQGCVLGEPVVVFGTQQGVQLGADALAKAAGTIAYEVLTNISPRVPRVYL